MKRAEFNAAAEQIGVKPDEFARLMGDAHWDVNRLEYELRQGEWQARLRQDLDHEERRREKRKGERICSALAGGPDWIANANRDELLEKIDARLVSFAETYVPADGGVLLLGPTGTGKTVSAGLAIARLAPDTLRLVWTHAAHLARAWAGHPLGQGEPHAVGAAERALLLVIDDWTWEKEGDTTIAEILATRYDRGLPTIATCGRSVEDLTKRVGNAVVRRVLESGGKKGQLINLFKGGK